jgi:hypothetical protein
MLRPWLALWLIIGAVAVARAEPHPATYELKPSTRAPNLHKIGEIGFELEPWTRGDPPRTIVHLESGAAEELAALHDSAAVVVTAHSATLVIDYPLDHPVEARIVAAAGNLTRADVVRAICDAYAQIYREERATSATPVTPPGKRGTLQNRNTTTGRYGIWGHDLRDLDLTGVEIHAAPNGGIYLMLVVDS